MTLCKSKKVSHQSYIQAISFGHNNVDFFLMRYLGQVYFFRGGTVDLGVIFSYVSNLFLD